MRPRPAHLLLTVPLLLGVGEPTEDEVIRSYAVALDAAADGSLRVEETIVYDFGDEERHGIVRPIPVRAPHEQTRDRLYPISDVQVDSPTGAPVETEVSTEDGVTTIRIGDPDEEVTGRQTYVLSYEVDGVADPGEAQDRLEWNAVGTEQQVPVDEVEVVLSGPTDLLDGSCHVPGGDATCQVDVTPDGNLTALARDLAPGEGVTVRADFPTGTFADARPILVDTFSPAQAFRVTPASVGAALAGLLLVGVPVVVRSRHGRARRSGRAVAESSPQLTPPQDARPAQLGTLVDGYAAGREVMATLLDLAVQGHLRFEEMEPEVDGHLSQLEDAGRPENAARPEDTGPVDWRLVRTEPRRARALRPYEQQLLDGVFTEGAQTVALSELQSSFSALDSQVRASMYRDVVDLGWFSADPATVRRRWYTVGCVVLAGGVALTVVLSLTSSWALAGLGVVAAGVVTLALAHRMPTRTPEGEQVRGRTEAFREQLRNADPVLSPTPRRDAGRPDDRADVASAYLPYAVALGVAPEWQAGLARTGPHPSPDWYASGHAGSAAVWPALLVLSSTSNPALSPPASSTGAGMTPGAAAGGGGVSSW